MSGWMIVAIVAIVMSGLVRIFALRNERVSDAFQDRNGSPLPMPSREEGASRAERREIEELRERIKVLERIATDSNTASAAETRRIAEEIDALRDRPHGG